MQSSNSKATAFTLVELITVVALLALGAVVLAPALARTQPNTRAVQCLHNLSLLEEALSMYSADSHDSFPPNRDGGNAGKDLADASWAGGWEDLTVDNPDNTNTDLLINHAGHPSAAYVGQYLKTAAPFRCPADTSQAIEGRALMNRVRSYSMQNWIGGDPMPGTADLAPGPAPANMAPITKIPPLSEGRL